jgi:integrase
MKGTVYQRAPGVFLIAIDHGRDAKGNRIRKWTTFKGTKRQAQNECARLITELKTGNYLEPSKTTVARYLEHWLTDMKARVSRKTHERYCEICRNNIAPLLGQIRLDELKPLHISQSWAKALESGRKNGGPLSPRSVHHMHTVFKSALEQAVDWEMLLRNPAAKVDPPQVPKQKLTTYDMPEVGRLIALLHEQRIYVPAFLSAMTGMRRGEVAAVRWKSVDLDAAHLTVVESIEQTNNAVAIKMPKSDRARSIALGPTLVAALRAHKAAQAQELLKLGVRQSGDTLVCAHPDGSLMHPRWISKKWAMAIKSSGLPRRGFHHLRHAHATQMLASGVHIKVASERLGHSTTGITLDLYQHVLPGMQEDAAARVDAAYQKAIAGPVSRDQT